MNCELCKRDVEEITFHHLIPLTLHSKKWYKKHYDNNYLKTNGINVCELCHKTIHQFYDEKTLGKKYNTIELLLKSELIQKYLKWAKKQK